MPVCGNYLFFELPKKIVLNPKDGDLTKKQAAVNYFTCSLPVSVFNQISLLSAVVVSIIATKLRVPKKVGVVYS